MHIRSSNRNSPSSTRESLAHNVKEVTQQIKKPVLQRLSSSTSTSNSETSPPASTGHRRPSFSMEHVLRPLKDKKEDKEREGRKEKRHSLTMRPGSNSKDVKDRKAFANSPLSTPKAPAKLSVIIESPPLVMFGPPSSSTGALLSGRLNLLVTDPSGQTKLEKLTMKLQATIIVKKPVTKDCPECTKRVNELTNWKFLSEPKTFRAPPEDNQFPFSFLLPGHLPATTHTSLGQIEYALFAEATTSTAETITYTHQLLVQRAIPPGPDKASIRIFPPTHLAGRVVLPPVVHPIGTFPVQMVLSGVVEKKPETQTRWRLRKMMWRIEEHQKMTSAPCPKHQHKVGDGKALQHQDTRIVGSDEAKSGWKTDFDTAGGEITMEFEAALDPPRQPHCDVDSPAGLEIKHNLVIELIVAEEFCPNKNPRMVTPTGAARVLRMQFNLNVTERAGMGISWDEEMPPVYEDVPESPPGYRYADAPGDECTITDYTGEPLEYEELERMHSENPDDPPVYRERTPPLTAGYAESSQRSAPRGQSGAESSSSVLTPRLQAQAASRGARFSVDDFGTEPPQYALTSRQESDDGNHRTEDLDIQHGQTA